MKHLEVARMLSLLAGGGNAADRAHLDGCAECRSTLEEWRAMIAALRELEANPIGADEMHNLRVLFNELGPARKKSDWLAHLLPGRELAVEPVRGELSASFEAYSAGPYEILVQVRPSEVAGRFDVQGQVVAAGGNVPQGSSVVLTSPEGHADRADVDSFGEFRLVGVPPGSNRMTWIIGDARVDLQNLMVGGPGRGTAD